MLLAWGPINALAATQGEWGRTSSATAKITLHIPPRPDPESGNFTARHENGFAALNHYCHSLQLGDTNPTLPVHYQFSLSGSEHQSQIANVLQRHCNGQNRYRERASTADGPPTITLLIAPY